MRDARSRARSRQEDEDDGKIRLRSVWLIDCLHFVVFLLYTSDGEGSGGCVGKTPVSLLQELYVRRGMVPKVGTDLDLRSLAFLSWICSKIVLFLLFSTIWFK